MAPRDPHYAGDYQTRRDRIVTAAKADPDTRCYHCGLRLDEHGPTKAGNPPTWSAEHIIPHDRLSALAPSVLSCNARAGREMLDAHGWKVPTTRW